MRLLLFVTEMIQIDPRVQLVIATDPRVLEWIKKEGKIKRLPCLWVKGAQFESIYYGESIWHYLDELFEVPPDTPAPTVPDYNPLPLESPPREEEATPNAPSEPVKKVFEPDYNDI